MKLECKISARFFLLSFLALVGAAERSPGAATEVSFGITSSTPFSLPHYIATERKYYESEAVAVDTIVVGAAVGLLKQLAGGSLNLAQAATDQSLRAMLHYMREQVIAREAALFPDGIKANLDALMEMGELTESPPLARFIDASFLAEASRQ
jgi:hypothetical protein